VADLPHTANKSRVVPLFWRSQLVPVKWRIVPQAPTANTSVAEVAQILVHAGCAQEGISGSCSAVQVKVLAARVTDALNVRGDPCRKAAAVAVSSPIVGPTTQDAAASPRMSDNADSGNTTPSPAVQ
jgi:hypothetical protein